jgi:hypothetical protein
MADVGRISINEADIVEVDADPSVSPGVPAPLGSLALLNVIGDNASYGIWQKVGPLDTDWKKANPSKKVGFVSAGNFTGSPKKAAVTFSTAFPNTSYAVTIMGLSDQRIWTYESITANGFTINANAAQALTGSVVWYASPLGETS